MSLVIFFPAFIIPKSRELVIVCLPFSSMHQQRRLRPRSGIVESLSRRRTHSVSRIRRDHRWWTSCTELPAFFRFQALLWRIGSIWRRVFSMRSAYWCCFWSLLRCSGDGLSNSRMSAICFATRSSASLPAAASGPGSRPCKTRASSPTLWRCHLRWRMKNLNSFSAVDPDKGAGWFTPWAAMGMPVGAFVTLGLMLGLVNIISKQQA